MFPVFSVLFPVCSQLKPMKRIAVPSVPSCSASVYFVKCDWVTWKSSERSGNTGNSRNNAVYQSVALFPVEDRSGNSGNKRREVKNQSRRRIRGKAPTESKGSGPRARQAVSPGFRAVACAALRCASSCRFASTMGDSPQLDSCYPRTSPVRQELHCATLNAITKGRLKQ